MVGSYDCCACAPTQCARTFQSYRGLRSSGISDVFLFGKCASFVLYSRYPARSADGRDQHSARSVALWRFGVSPILLCAYDSFGC